MIGIVAVRFGPSSNVSATWRAAVGPCVTPPPNQCTVGVSAPTYNPVATTAITSTTPSVRADPHPSPSGARPKGAHTSASLEGTGRDAHGRPKRPAGRMSSTPAAIR